MQRRRTVEILAALGITAALVGIAYVATARGGGVGSTAPTPEATWSQADDNTEEGNNADSFRIVYPPEWMAGNCGVWGGGFVEITSPAAAARGGRVFEKDGEIFYSLANGRCVTLIGAPTPAPDWIPESLENMPTPRPDNRPTIQIDPSNLPPALRNSPTPPPNLPPAPTNSPTPPPNPPPAVDNSPTPPPSLPPAPDGAGQ